MKYRLPDDCLGVSHAGAQLAIADDGSLDLDEASASALAPHGLTPVGDPEPRSDKPRRDDDGDARDRSGSNRK